jgi:KDO2-lipid IV(A) lauroyltransferase
VLDNTRQPIPLRQFSGPRHWPTWIMLFLMWSVAHLPFFLQIRSGQLLGLLSYYLARNRRRVCEINLRLCFPKLSNAEHKQLVKKTFISNGIGLIEVAIAWYRDPEDYRSLLSVSRTFRQLSTPSPHLR